MNQNPVTNTIYDYIIIGSGPAGAVMAKTLSDNLKYSVLVLEAGDNNTEDIPIKVPSTQTWRHTAKYFWQGRTAPQTQAFGKLFPWTSGRLLGGGSSVNGQQYVRPTISILSEWEKLLGPMWSVSQSMNYLKQLENYNGWTYSPEFRGYHGPINIKQTPINIPKLTKKFVTAVEQGTGYPIILDYNDPNTPVGPFFQWQLYQQPNDLRDSAATAFLSPDVMTPDGFGVNGRRLRVLLKSTGLKVLFNKNKEAIGVKYLREGSCQCAFSRKKVIISAGINSSQLLMLSGIGPEEELEKFDIPIVYNNPNVGKNLTNHVYTSASFTINPDDIPDLSREPAFLYFGGALLPYPNQSDHRSIQMIGTVSNNQLVVFIINLFPQSRGSITLQNDDPLKIVHADLNILQSPIDVAKMNSVYKDYIIKIANQLHSIDPAYQLISPSVNVINNDEQLDSYIRRNVDVTYHEQSFNRMAPLDQGGVVDSFGHVYGVHNLIIADTSIIPTTIDSNNASSSYLIGYTIANQLLDG